MVLGLLPLRPLLPAGPYLHVAPPLQETGQSPRAESSLRSAPSPLHLLSLGEFLVPLPQAAVLSGSCHPLMQLLVHLRAGAAPRTVQENLSPANMQSSRSSQRPQPSQLSPDFPALHPTLARPGPPRHQELVGGTMAGGHVPATPPLQACPLLPAVASSGRQWSSMTLGFLFWKILALRITRGPVILRRSWPHACIISRVDPAQPPPPASTQSCWALPPASSLCHRPRPPSQSRKPWARPSGGGAPEGPPRSIRSPPGPVLRSRAGGAVAHRGQGSAGEVGSLADLSPGCRI